MALELTDEQIDEIVDWHLTVAKVVEGHDGQMREFVVRMIEWYNGGGEFPDGPGLVIASVRTDLEKYL